jgi:nucleolar protein 14
MFMRFQKEKVKHVRNSSAFNLESGDTEVLTHRGQVLGNSNLEDNDWVSSDEEEGGGRLNKQVVNDLHFGGGFQEKRPTEELPGKGRLDALQEIVMKSKLHKMQKKEAKEEQEEERTKLDKAYQELFSSSMLDFNPTGSDKKYGRSAGSNTADALDDYDIALKEMAYEAKLPASERTKTAEEIALEEQKRIEELEEARLKRMKAPKHNPADAENDDEADGKNAKRKRRTDDQIEDDGYKVVGKNRTNPRDARKEKASDDALSGEAYKEYIMQDEEYSDSDEEEEDGDEEDEEDEGDEDEEDGLDYESDPEAEEGEEGSDAEDGDEDDEEDEEEQVVAPVSKGKKAPAEATSKAPVAISSKATTKQSKAVTEEVCDGVNIEMPHKIDCPPDLEAFDELVEQYVLNGNTDMQALIDRILAWNNVHLPGAEGKENRNLMHNFLDILLKHLIRVGDSLPSNDTEQLKQSMDMVSKEYRRAFWQARFCNPFPRFLFFSLTT